MEINDNPELLRKIFESDGLTNSQTNIWYTDCKFESPRSRVKNENHSVHQFARSQYLEDEDIRCNPKPSVT